jgi:hypothetical protein
LFRDSIVETERPQLLDEMVDLFLEGIRSRS